MALDVLELHHHAVRMPLAKVAAMGAFYGDVLGLDTDKGRWEIPGIAGYFLDPVSYTHLTLPTILLV